MSAYVYTGNNPIMLVDPDGKRIKPKGKKERKFLKTWVAINFGDDSGITIKRNSVVIDNERFSIAMEQMDSGTRQLAETFSEVVKNSKTVHFKLGEIMKVNNSYATGRTTIEYFNSKAFIRDEIITRTDEIKAEYGVTRFVGDKFLVANNHAILINPINHFEENGVRENKYATFSHEIGHMSLFLNNEFSKENHHFIAILFENITRMKMNDDFRTGILHEH